jgi:hypothetical protein
MSQSSREILFPNPRSGLAMLVPGILLTLAFVPLMIFGVREIERGHGPLGAVLIVLAALTVPGPCWCSGAWSW